MSKFEEYLKKFVDHEDEVQEIIKRVLRED